MFVVKENACSALRALNKSGLLVDFINPVESDVFQRFGDSYPTSNLSYRSDGMVISALPGGSVGENLVAVGVALSLTAKGAFSSARKAITSEYNSFGALNSVTVTHLRTGLLYWAPIRFSLYGAAWRAELLYGLFESGSLWMFEHTWSDGSRPGEDGFYYTVRELLDDPSMV